MTTLTRNNPQSWFNTIYNALDLVIDQIPEDQWDDVATAMAWVAEELNQHAGYSIDDQP
jgi:hypothetical protein